MGKASFKVLANSLLVSLASLLVSFFSFVNQIILANFFGASSSMDAYLIGTSIPMLVSGLLTATLAYTLVPALMLNSSNLASYRRFSGLLLIIFSIISLAIVCVGILTAADQIELLSGKISLAAKQEAIVISRISWIAAGLMVLVAYLNGIYNAANRFLLPIFLSIAPYIFMAGAGILFASTLGPMAVVFGLMLGFLVIIPALFFQMLPRIDMSYSSLQQWRDVVRYLSRLPLIMLAMLCFTVFQLSDSYWAPNTGTGNLAYLGYSQRLLVALGTLVVAGPSAVILPRLAISYTDGRIKDLLHDALRGVRMIIVVALPLALIASVLAAPLIRILFQRGAFDQHATQGLAAILPLMMFGMVAMLCVVMVFRALYAKHDVIYASLLGILIAISYFTLSGVLSRTMGVMGIALAYALTWWLILIFSIAILWRGYMKMILSKANFMFIGQLMLLTLVTIVVAATSKSLIVNSDINLAILMLQISTVATLTFAFYVVVAIRILKLEEMHLIYTFFFTKFTSLMLRNSRKTL
jgi:putative peptidoglycan lipid II flippase